MEHHPSARTLMQDKYLLAAGESIFGEIVNTINRDLLERRLNSPYLGPRHTIDVPPTLFGN